MWPGRARTTRPLRPPFALCRVAGVSIWPHGPERCRPASPGLTFRTKDGTRSRCLRTGSYTATGGLSTPTSPTPSPSTPHACHPRTPPAATAGRSNSTPPGSSRDRWCCASRVSTAPFTFSGTESRSAIARAAGCRRSSTSPTWPGWGATF